MSSSKSIQEQFYNILDAIPASVYWKDREGKYLGCNKYMVNMAGARSRDEIIGKTDAELPWKDFSDAIRDIDQNVINSAESCEAEETPRLDSGEQRTFLTSKKPLFDDVGQIIGIIGTSIDITERKQAEENEKIALKKAMMATVKAQAEEEKRKAVQILAASIAHELRTPLAAIGVRAELLQELIPAVLAGYEKVADQLDNVLMPLQLTGLSVTPSIIRNEVHSAQTVIDLLLMNIRQADKLIVIGEQPFSMKECINAALARYPFSVQQREKINWANNSDFLLRGDQELMIYVIFNLLKNALYFIAKVRKGDITLTLEETGTSSIFCFRDTGPGIAEEDLPHIFERFFSKDTHHGSGIGLSFCKTVVEAHGGTIECQTKQGEYTLFIMQFPRYGIAKDH